MDVTIRPASENDLEQYSSLLQKTYQETYPDDELGLTKDLYSERVFSSERIQSYLKANLLVNDKQKAWLAFINHKLVGSITIKDTGKEFELVGLYVSRAYQSRGVGKMLMEKALDFAKSKDIVLDLYINNIKAIDFYKKWGFKIDFDKGTFFRHWPEWPQNVKAEHQYMRLTQ